MTIRERLLAILKEPDRYACRDDLAIVVDTSEAGHDVLIVAAYGVETARAIADDLNASHRLKRLCEEMAQVALEDITISFDTSKLGPGSITRAKTSDEIAAAILAMGRSNEHS